MNEIAGIYQGRVASDGPREGLLVVLESADDGDKVGNPVLAVEGTRLAHRLGVELHLLILPSQTTLDIETAAAALADVASRDRPVAVLLANTDTGRQLAPMVAFRLGSGCVVGCSDVLVRNEETGAMVGVGGDARTSGGRVNQAEKQCAQSHQVEHRRTLVFVKPVYGGWLEREVMPEKGTIPVVTLELHDAEEPGSFSEEVCPPELLLAEIPSEPRIRRLVVIPPDAGSIDLVHARRIITAGSGSTGGNLLEAVRELARLLGGSVGATRPVVDDGSLPKERLIGQTGRTVTPELYFALGVSGSPHHMAGVRRADRMLAIDRDVSASIFRFSDVGYVGDLEVILPALVKRIKEWRDAPSNPGSV